MFSLDFNLSEKDGTGRAKISNPIGKKKGQMNKKDSSFLKLKKEFENVFSLFRGSFPKNENAFNGEGRRQEEIIRGIILKHSSPSYQKRIADELCGYGPLEPLLENSCVNEIIVNNKHSIAFEREGVLYVLPDEFLSRLTFDNIIERICTEAHLTVNLKKPFAEGKWRYFRVHITRPPLVREGFHLILRRHPKNIWTFKRLLEESWAPESAVSILKEFIRKKYNILIVGGTSSGKTSLLNACLQELPENERVVIIEDADEILIPNSVSTKLLTQTSPESSLPFIDQEILLKQSLRLRPDRIVMGEVRGGEAKDLLLALSSGHRGSLGTIHGETHHQAVWKIETLAQIGAPQWNYNTIRRLIFSGLQGVVVLERRDSLRLLKGIYQISSLEETGFLFESLYERENVHRINE